MRKVWNRGKVVFIFFLYLLAVRHNAAAQKLSDRITVVLDTDPLSQVTAWEICRKESEQEQPRSVCFWGEIPRASLFCKETGQSSTVTAVLVTGNPGLAVPETDSLAYQKEGCFLDAQTARELFGTDQADGQILWYEDRGYTVCGTFESLEKIMVCQAREEDGAVLHMISLYSGYVPKASGTLKADMRLIRSGSSDAEQLLLRHGLSGTVLDTVFLQTLVNNLLLLLPLITGLRLFGLLKKEFSKGQSRWGKLFLTATGIAAAAALGILTITQLQIPADMIPSRWSDFSFWSIWWKRQQRNLLLLLATAQGEAHLTMLWNLLLAFFYNLCAVFLVNFA